MEETVDLPVAIEPVSPMISILALDRGQETKRVVEVEVECGEIKLASAPHWVFSCTSCSDAMQLCRRFWIL